jgi:hypothetical protein
MKSLYQPEVLEEVLARLGKLTPDARRVWGRMDAAQMLAHCICGLRTATGEQKPDRVPLGRILGPLFKPLFVNDKPLRRNSPTDKSFIISDTRDFQKEKAGLIDIITRFSRNGASQCTTHPHAFFGKLSPEEWGIGMYKHLDHHFRQFGG